MRDWWAALAGVALIALGYLGDQSLGALYRETAASSQSQYAFLLDALARLVAMALLAGLGWLVAHGPRTRLVGATMAIVGLYFSLVPALSIALLANTGIALPPFAVEAYRAPTRLQLLLGGGVAILGMVELLWRNPNGVREGKSPRG